MNKEPTKLRDLIQSDDEERAIEIDESGIVVKDTLSIPGGVSSVDIQELQTELAITDRLLELEHNVAEAAIRECQLREQDDDHLVGPYLNEAVKALTKFKEETK